MSEFNIKAMEEQIVNFFQSPHLIKGLPPEQEELVFENHDNGAYQFNPKDIWIQTFTGKRFTPLNPHPSSIDIEDIAHSLSMMCRFNGHCKLFYSVAQHSVLVSYLCNPEDALFGLLHDASEAYLSDISSPIKKTVELEQYRKIEFNLMKIICQKFSLPENEPPSVKRADQMILRVERKDLMSPRNDWSDTQSTLPMSIIPLNPTEAKELFLNRFKELTNG